MDLHSCQEDQTRLGMMHDLYVGLLSSVCVIAFVCLFVYLFAVCLSGCVCLLFVYLFVCVSVMVSKHLCVVFRPHIKTIFQGISAKVNEEPCCDWVSHQHNTVDSMYLLGCFVCVGWS